MKFLGPLACLVLASATANEMVTSETHGSRLGKLIGVTVITTGLLGTGIELLKAPFAKKCISLATTARNCGIPANHILGPLALISLYAYGAISGSREGNEWHPQRKTFAAIAAALAGFLTAKFWNYGIRQGLEDF